MLLRLILSILLVWAVFRLIRAVARGLPRRRREPERTVHPSPSKRRNPLQGGRVIDVDFTESSKTSKTSKEGDKSS